MKILGIIPARFASTRFPGKPLAIIAGTSMIERVYMQAKKATSLTDIAVATDDDRIFNHVKGFGGHVVMTSPLHNTGTERCLEACRQLSLHNTYDVVVNIQGDEPLIDPQQIDRLALCFNDKDTLIATLAKALTDSEDKHNPNIVKVVTGKANRALYFSRFPIPFVRDSSLPPPLCFKHLGLYAYRTAVLEELCKLVSTPLEKAESLEQLRWLENGYPITVAITDTESLAVDVPDDIHKVETYIKSLK